MIDVLQVNKLYHPHIGGVEQVVRLLAEGFAARPDVRSRVLACNEGLCTVRETVNGVEVTRAGSLCRVMSEPLSPSFPRCLRRSDADIYHFHNPFPLGEAAALTLDEGTRMVTTYHSDVVRQRRFLRAYAPVLRRFLGRSRVILVSSPQLVRSSPFLRPLSGRCRVVHFGIDAHRFETGGATAALAEKIREKYAGDRALVLFVGRLVYYKGVAHLLDAMQEVEASLLLLGTGPLRGELEAAARARGLSGRVHFVSRAEEEEMAAYYHACDILVLPSTARSEAFGLVILEAMACGKPVVSTELGTGTSYANLDGQTGLVVPPGDTRALADAMKRLLGDAALREEMGARGRERVRREFALSDMLDEVAEIYAEVMQEGG